MKHFIQHQSITNKEMQKIGATIKIQHQHLKEKELSLGCFFRYEKIVKQEKRSCPMSNISPEAVKTIKALLNIGFLIINYHETMKIYKNEDNYQGQLSNELKYFHIMQDIANKSKEGWRIVFQELMKTLLPAIIWIGVTLYLDVASNNGKTFSNLLISSILLIIVGVPVFLTFLVMCNNQIYPEGGVISRYIRKELKEDVENILMSTILKPTPNDIFNIEWSVDTKYIDPKVKETINVIKQNNFLDKEATFQLLSNLKEHACWRGISESDEIMWSIYANDAEQCISCWEKKWDKKTNDEKHKEFVSSRRTSLFIFIIIAVVTSITLF